MSLIKVLGYNRIIRQVLFTKEDQFLLHNQRYDIIDSELSTDKEAITNELKR